MTTEEMPSAASPDAPPETDRRPVTEALHGVEITDPYRWLEDDSEEVAEWTDAQNEYAREVLETPHRDALESYYEGVVRVTDYESVTAAGDRYFQEIAGPEDEQPTLYVFDSLADLRDGDGRTLVDPTEFDETGTTSMDWYVPGPEGDLLAYGIAEGGDEQYDVHVVDVDDGSEREVLREVGRIGGERFGWVTPDDDEMPVGFYYVSTGNAADGTQLQKELRYHELGTEMAADTVVTDEFTERQWPTLDTDGETLVVQTMEDWTRSDVFVYDGPPRAAELTPVVTGYDALFQPELSEETLYLLTNESAPFRRVVATPLSDALDDSERPVSEFTTVVPESEAVLRSIEVTDSHLYVHAHRNAHSELSVYDETTAELTEIDLPEFCSVQALSTGSDGSAFFLGTSYTDPLTVCRVHSEDASVETLTQQDVAVPFEITVSQEWFTSADGTEVPAFVVRREGVTADGTNPALLTGYGGFKINRTPAFDRFSLPFLRAGGVKVVANLRGGSEFGEQWHAEGRRENKQNVFDDAIAVAEGLIERGWAAADALGVAGGSNGGLLVGALVTQRPDLWSGALCNVPLLDMLRFHQFLLGESWTSEYGSPDDPEAFAYLREYSPYHNVSETAYPATLFTTALGDTRVHPSHARKMAARMQAATTGSDPILLRVDDESGHGVGKPTSMQIREQAERWGFLSKHLGVDALDLAE
jgi:prolyl oligopeptidase